jgi:hypothetical protein
MPKARAPRQKDWCPWQRLALVTLIIGISCTTRADRTCAYLSRLFGMNADLTQPILRNRLRNKARLVAAAANEHGDEQHAEKSTSGAHSGP